MSNSPLDQPRDGSPSQSDLAARVLRLLKSAKLTRDDEALQTAADLSKIMPPTVLAGLTPRFEAHFAIATLIKSLRHREDPQLIEQRFEHALSLTTSWVKQLGENANGDGR